MALNRPSVPYIKTTDFQEFQNVNPNNPLPATDVDRELENVELTIDEIRQRLQMIQRDDGQVANRTIGVEQLKAELLAGVNPPTEWEPTTIYSPGDTVVTGTSWLLTREQHLSASTLQEDIDAGYWFTLIDLTVPINNLITLTTPENWQDIDTVATNIADINTTADNMPDIYTIVANLLAINTNADNIADINTAAANIVDINNFSDVWQGAKANNPANRNDGSPLQAGDLYFNTGAKSIKVWSGSAWVTQSPFSGVREVIELSSGQTQVTFNNNIASAGLYVFGTDVDNSRLLQDTDYTANFQTNTVTLTQTYPAGTLIVSEQSDVSTVLEASTMQYTPNNNPPTSVGQALDNRQKVFDNVAAMQADSTLYIGQKVRTLGYYSVGDGGGCDYEIVAADTSTVDGGSFINLTGIAGQAKGLFGSVVNVKQFGAVGDGITDDTLAIQATINLRLHLYIPVGIYRLTNTLSIDNKTGLTIEGAGKGSILQQAGDYGDIIHAFSNGGPHKGITLKHFTTKPSIASVTSGSAIHFDGCRDFVIHDVLIDDAFVGITLAGCSQGVVTDVLCLYESNNGGVIAGRKYVHILETTNPNIVSKHCGDIFFDNFNGRCGGFDACEHGVVINSMDGVWFDNFHIGNCTNSSILIDANSTIKCTGGMFTHGWLDIGAASDVVIRGSTPSLNGHHYFRNNKLLGGNSGSHGFDIDGSAVRLVIQDNEISNYANAGIIIRSSFTGNGDIVGNTIRDCSQEGVGAAPGINYQSNTFWRIENNNIFGNNHDRHITITGSKTEARINNNLLGRIFLTAAMNDLLGTHISQRDNRGYNPKGPVSVPVGSSPWTYTNSWGFPVEIQIRGGTISQIIKDTQTYNTVVKEGAFMLDPGKSLTITYSQTPFVYIYGH